MPGFGSTLYMVWRKPNQIAEFQRERWCFTNEKVWASMGFPLLKARDIQVQYHIFSNKQFSYLTGKQYTNKTHQGKKE